MDQYRGSYVARSPSPSHRISSSFLRTPPCLPPSLISFLHLELPSRLDRRFVFLFSPSLSLLSFLALFSLSSLSLAPSLALSLSLPISICVSSPSLAESSKRTRTKVATMFVEEIVVARVFSSIYRPEVPAVRVPV